jgi:acetoin utilization deacetylase AcuC-like enzyme
VFDLFYHPIYTDGIHKESRFPRERYQLTREALDKSEHAIRFIEPKMVEIQDIYLVHDKNYVDAFIKGTLSDKQKRKIGLQPWNEHIIDRTKYIMGGSLGALKSAMNSNGISGNMAGGTHHAHFSEGSGYCIFNDIAICSKVAQRDYEEINNVMIIDLDVHQGDGTASIFSNDNSVFTFSMHCESNFPLKKMVSDLDVPLKKGTTDTEYLNILQQNLVKLDQIPSDIIFFQAGVDILDSDGLGYLSLSRSGLIERNEMVFDFAKERDSPLVVFMGGGYSKPIEHTVKSFVDLFEQCALYPQQ